MKTTYKITFEKNEIYHTNMVNAESISDVEKHYSKYNVLEIREARDFEIEEAERKHIPVITIEHEPESTEPGPETAENVAFPNLAKLVSEAGEKRKVKSADFIRNGFTDYPEKGIRDYSTATRWKQYQDGEITREKAVELAIKRMNKKTDKRTAEKLARLETVAGAKIPEYATMSIVWKRNYYWGYNPTARLYDSQGTQTNGHASGCGYDKESAAASEALNSNPGILKMLYTLAEKALASGKSPEKTSVCSGYSWGHVLGYGSGYDSLPYFEPGVGIGCFWSIIEKVGYRVICDRTGKHENIYTIVKR